MNEQYELAPGYEWFIDDYLIFTYQSVATPLGTKGYSVEFLLDFQFCKPTIFRFVSVRPIFCGFFRCLSWTEFDEHLTSWWEFPRAFSKYHVCTKVYANCTAHLQQVSSSSLRRRDQNAIVPKEGLFFEQQVYNYQYVANSKDTRNGCGREKGCESTDETPQLWEINASLSDADDTSVDIMLCSNRRG